MSLYWHDYETFGIDPARGRPAQFAGIRTDEDLNILGEPLVLYCKPSMDMLPEPESCLVTGITPQHAAASGVCEAEFISRIERELAYPGTCGVGYNSIRFDDEFTRNSLYRNFHDPYAREWQNGCSRWDIIDMMRLMRAFRPEGMAWPENDGRPSFRLEALTEANGVIHEAAHDALSDVQATIALARLVKRSQPRLYDYVYRYRDKKLVSSLLALRIPVLHVSSMYPSEYGSTALVLPVASHPVNRNEVVVYDLRYDPTELIGLDAEEIRRRLFTPRNELEDAARIPLKTVHVNKCPIVATEKLLTPEIAERLKIDSAQGHAHAETIRRAAGLEKKLELVYAQRERPMQNDPDLALYSGFFSNSDRAKMEIVRAASPDALRGLNLEFEDERLPEMLFRYRARNWPETLSAHESARWEASRRTRIDAQAYFAKIAALREAGRDPAILDALDEWGRTLTA